MRSPLPGSVPHPQRTIRPYPSASSKIRKTRSALVLLPRWRVCDPTRHLKGDNADFRADVAHHLSPIHCIGRLLVVCSLAVAIPVGLLVPTATAIPATTK